MDYKVIKKPDLKSIYQMPNLEDYKKACSEFEWTDIEKELDGLGDGKLNIAYEAVDRHLKTDRKNKVAFVWEGKDGAQEKYTFLELSKSSDRFANVLANLGVEKGDRVFVFLDRVPELYISVLGTLKIGAIIGPLFSAFGPDAVKDRLMDSEATVLITSSRLKNKIEDILKDLPDLKHIIIVNRGGEKIELCDREVSYGEEMAKAKEDFDIVKTSKEDYAIMHYTSGTTGKPKGVVHAHAAIIGHYATAKYVLDLHENDIYWCTADPGWVTGTSYGIFGPWSNGVTQVIYEGGFNAKKWYSTIEKYKVTVWYTAPTAIRMLMRFGDELPKKFDLSSLRHACSVGEPLNPEAVVWSEKVIGTPFHDNWWQTETGCILIANYPVQNIKPGSMGRPFPGISPAILDDKYQELPHGKEGHLAIKPGWPSMFRTYWKKDKVYDSRFNDGWYITGDKAKRDEDGYFWFVGRADDVINTAGHLVGPFEVESALIEHPAVAEAGVIGKPDPIVMETIKAFVSLKEGFVHSEELKHDIQRFVKKKLSSAAYPREIEFLDTLPKTRSGKIMRRLLKARELGLPEGDTSTLEE
ncbi:MAG: acetate--CoA ligase [Candidatus Hydrothermarchaeaceae archaeon]